MYSKLEKLLKKKGITAYRLCTETGIDKASITHWKNGTCKPSVKSLAKLSDYFQVPIEYFL